MNFPADHPYALRVLLERYLIESIILRQRILSLYLGAMFLGFRCKNKPSDSATVYYIDVDPLKGAEMPLWYIPIETFL